MMEQYWEVRNSLPSDTLLMFRLGDFYEMFYDDAVEGAKLLGITLTKRQNYPMAGIPYHAVEQYLPRLLSANKKVAICEQDETPRAGKLVKRSISRIITPGTLIEDTQLDGHHSNFNMAIDIGKLQKLYAAWLDISTGEFYCAEFANPSDFLPLLSAVNPKEILLPENASRKWAESAELSSWNSIFRTLVDIRPVTLLHDYRFEPQWGSVQIKGVLGVLNLDGFGIERDSPLAGPAGALVYYATENLRSAPRNIRTIRKFSCGKYVLIDPATQRSLEIFRSYSGSTEGSLLSIMDRTVTAAGARLLETYLASPTLDVEEIQRRQDTVWELYASPLECESLRKCMLEVRDIPRILGRLQNRMRSPREILAILASIEQFKPIKLALLKCSGKKCRELAEKINDFTELKSYLKRALSDDAPSKIQDGGAIKDGFDAELDRLRKLGDNNSSWLSQLEREEQERTGIKNLRVKFNGIFGYFIEVTKSNLDLVPPEYIRRQTMANAERYTTPELREKEKEILHSAELAKAREEELFSKIISTTLHFYDALIKASEAISQADLFRGWAELAREWDYCKPEINHDGSITIEEGRHPVVEQMLRRGAIGLAQTGRFVPNDANLSSDKEQIALITGPNMAGKSTYIRQIALICIMAQVGSFVPAKRCLMGVVDRIFSRVGASDELSRGNSTFMVEMNETANILNNATDNSLIILDEIGRGTSTYDGLSIAWAVAEFIHGKGSSGPKTLFATHYHEITELEQTLPRLVNYRISVKEWNDDIIFTRRIERGAADRSYGIQVARLAGLPREVIERAKEVLSELESEGNSIIRNLGAAVTNKSKPGRSLHLPKSPSLDPNSNFKQLSLF